MHLLTLSSQQAEKTMHMFVRRQVAYEEHRLKPFSGLEISVSGGYGGEKQKAAELVRQHGGTYTPNMTRSCTHLVILGPKGDNRDVSTKET